LLDITVDNHHSRDHASRHTVGADDALLDVPNHDHTGDAGDGGQIAHSALSGVGVNDHHNQAHVHSAGDGGQLDWDVCWADAVHSHTSAAEGGTLDHGALTGRTDDDHAQYLLATGARTGASSQAQTFTSGIKTNTVAERSSGSGVTIDSLKIQDGSVYTSTALGCLVYHNASRSIAHNVPTTLNFNSEIHDTDGIHDTTSGVRHKFTAKHAGYYIAGASVRWDGSTASRRMALIACLYDGSDRNLARNDLHTDQNAVAGMSVTTGMFYMNGTGDYVYFNVYQDSGDYMDIRAASTTNLHECNGWIVRVA
jgi:hypothetical protein